MSTLVFDPHAPAPPPVPVRPAALAVGLAVLAGERLRAGGQDRLALALGLAAQAAEGARRAAGPPIRAASRAGRALSRVPGAGLAARPARAGRERVAALLSDARRRGRATVAADRVEALRFLRTAVPRVTDDLMPYLTADLMPRLIEGVLPEIRARVLPVIVDDLSADPRIRQLVVEQSRGVLGDAAQQLRATAASADDRVESLLRRLLGRAAPSEPATDLAGG